MAEIIPVEVELVVKQVKGKLNDLRGATKTAGNAPASKGETGIMALITKALGPILKIVAIATILGIVLSGLKMSMKMLSRIFDVLSRLLRPIDYVIGQMLLVVLRMIMPLVRAVNMMFRPFMQQIREGLKANKESGGGAIGGLAVIGQVFGKFIAYAFSMVLEEQMKGIINIMFAVTEIIVTVISGLAILIVRLMGFGEIADQLGPVLAGGIANIDLMRQTMLLLTEQGFNAFREGLMGLDTLLLKGKEDIDPFTTLLQGMLTGIATTLDENFGKSLEEKLEGTNEAVADMKLLFEENGINGATLNSVLTILESKLKLTKTDTDNLTKSLYQQALKASTLRMTLNLLIIVFEKMINAVTSAYNTLMGYIGSVKSFLDNYDSDKGLVGNIMKGSDFISRPNGSMIKFDPNDTIMGFKNDKAGLGGSLNSGGMNVVVNVNGYVGNETQLAKLIGEEMRKQVKLTSTYGKSF